MQKKPATDLSDGESVEEEEPGMVQAGKDKEGNSFFDLNSKKKVFIKSYKGQKMVDIREVYDKNGEMMFTAKGVCLTMDAWKTLKDLIPSIERELK